MSEISSSKKIKKKRRKANGNGTFRKRTDGSIEYRVYYNQNGNKIRKSFYGHTQAECKDKRDAYEEDTLMTLDGIVTVGEWAEKWLPLYKKNKCGEGTYNQYKYIIADYIVPKIGHLNLNDVKPAHILEMMNEYSGKSNSLVKKILMTTRSIFETAIDNDYCIKNPARNIKIEGVKPAKKKFFNDKEIAIIKRFCHKERSNISDALYTLLYTGMRREEILGLKWEDIDFKNNTIKLERTVILVNGKKVIKNTMKNEPSRRTIPLAPQLKRLLKTKERNGEFVFPLRNGDFQSPDGFSSGYGKLLKRINRFNDSEHQIRLLSPHCCRHTYASYLSKNGIDIKVIQSILGHSDISMTGNVYTHSTIEGLQEAIKGFKF